MKINRKHVCILVVILVFLFEVFALSQTNVNSYSTDTLINGACYYDDLVKTYTGNISLVINYHPHLNNECIEIIREFLGMKYPAEGLNKPVTHSVGGMVITDGIRTSYEYTTVEKYPDDSSAEIKFKHIYNGETWEALKFKRSLPDGMYKPSGSIGETLYTGLNPFFITEDINLRRFGAFLENHKNDIVDFKYNSEEDLIELSITFQEKSYDINISPQTMYRPTSVIFKDNKSIITITCAYQEYAHNMWFPREIAIIHADKDKNQAYDSKLSIQSGFILNSILTDNMFKIEFPIGTMIHNYTTDHDYRYAGEYEE